MEIWKFRHHMNLCTQISNNLSKIWWCIQLSLSHTGQKYKDQPLRKYPFRISTDGLPGKSNRWKFLWVNFHPPFCFSFQSIPFTFKNRWTNGLDFRSGNDWFAGLSWVELSSTCGIPSIVRGRSKSKLWQQLLRWHSGEIVSVPFSCYLAHRTTRRTIFNQSGFRFHFF